MYLLLPFAPFVFYLLNAPSTFIDIDENLITVSSSLSEGMRMMRGDSRLRDRSRSVINKELFKTLKILFDVSQLIPKCNGH